MDSSSLICALRRLLSIRGPVSKLRCDWHKRHRREVGAGQRIKRTTVKESREMGHRARLRMAV